MKITVDYPSEHFNPLGKDFYLRYELYHIPRVGEIVSFLDQDASFEQFISRITNSGKNCLRVKEVHHWMNEDNASVNVWLEVSPF